MEDLNRYYLNLFRSDDWDLNNSIADIIQEYTCNSFLGINNYDDLIYKLKWPTEEEQQAFAEARADYSDMKPILLKGVIIDNQINDSTGKRCLHVVGANQFEYHEVTDASWLLHLRKVTRGVVCSLHVYTFRNDFIYSIPLENLRPGTRVILSLVNFRVASEESKTIIAYCTDVILDDPTCELTNYEFVDGDYRLHGASDFLNIYKALRDKIMAEREKDTIGDPNSSSSNEGCYIATAVYGSYDCPEVWTLRRFRDNILAKVLFGQLFIKAYYAISPTLVKWFGKTRWFQNLWKMFLDKLVSLLQHNGIASDRYEDNL